METIAGIDLAIKEIEASKRRINEVLDDKIYDLIQLKEKLK